MIYLVTNQTKLFDSDLYKTISVEDSLTMMNSWGVIQFDSETTGRDAHINTILCVQFGNDAADTQIVVDCTTVNIKLYKNLIESKPIIGQNLKFDIQFLYSCGIIPTKVYDTMIVEQLIYLGYPKGIISYSLKSIVERRLGIDIDKTVRGEIIWRGLDSRVILYAAGDVMYLEKIMSSQMQDLQRQDLIKAARIENRFVPVIAYLEWCGIYLNANKWSAKMVQDQENLTNSLTLLNNYIVNHPVIGKKYSKVNNQLDLFEDVDLTPKCTVLWSSSGQVIQVAKDLGFDTVVQDKVTGEDKDSVLEKHLRSQKGIDDEFLKLYFDYQGYFKVVSSFGQGHLNMINPNTNRIHTVYWQLGAASGRMSCGSQNPNTDLADLKHISPHKCTYANIQQLPSDSTTRGSFTNQFDNTAICSVDFSALESRLGADIYNEPAMIDEYLHGSGDMHSLMAITFFGDQMEEGITTKEVKKKYPHLRKEAKSPEFLIQFGGSAFGLAKQLGISEELAQSYVDKYYNKFKGIADFKANGSKFVRENGYILMCKYSGHKMYWWDHDKWLKRQQSFTNEFWEDYKLNHKGTGDAVCKEVSMHFKAASKWDRMALNSVTQGSGIVILKIAMRNYFEWILNNNLFEKVKIVALVHDEAVIEFDKSIEEAPLMLQKCMEEAAALICTKLPIPAEGEVSDHWVH